MNRTVLLVEDSKFLKLATQRLLIKAGYEVVTAEDGEEALTMANKILPNIILLDMLLPKLDGSQVLSRLKKNPATASIPVIVLTGLSSKNAPKLLEAGAAEFVDKNRILEDSDFLVDVIRQTLPLRAVIPSQFAAERPTIG